MLLSFLHSLPPLNIPSFHRKFSLLHSPLKCFLLLPLFLFPNRCLHLSLFFFPSIFFVSLHLLVPGFNLHLPLSLFQKSLSLFLYQSLISSLFSQQCFFLLFGNLMQPFLVSQLISSLLFFLLYNLLFLRISFLNFLSC